MAGEILSGILSCPNITVTLFITAAIHFRPLPNLHNFAAISFCLVSIVITCRLTLFMVIYNNIWAASSEFGTNRLCEQQRFRRACASAQSRQNLHCSLIQAVSQEEPSDRKPDPWPLWMAGHAQLKFVMTECSKTQIRLTRHIYQTCHKLWTIWTEICEIRQNFKGDLMKFCDIFTKITLELPQNRQKPLFKLRSLW